MGTRADFYVGTLTRPKAWKYLGSIPYDGYPAGEPAILIVPRTVEGFLGAVKRIRKKFGQTARPSWPWAYEDSTSTDYTYLWEIKKKAVLYAYFGGFWSYHDFEHHGFSQCQSSGFPCMRSLTCRGPRH